MEIVDANIILRFLLEDNQEMANTASIILTGRSVYLLVEIIAEVVYVMEKVYKIERNIISTTMLNLIEYDNIIVDNDDIIRTALETYKNNNLDFVDCILFGYRKCRNAHIHTFDKKLTKALES